MQVITYSFDLIAPKYHRKAQVVKPGFFDFFSLLSPQSVGNNKPPAIRVVAPGYTQKSPLQVSK